MDINEFTKAHGEFLKAKVVKENPNALFEITGEATVEKNEKFQTDRLYIPVRLGEMDYTFDCSRTNARFISGKLGLDTKKWIGKHLGLETYKTKTTKGEMTDAINVKAVN